jgi:hypothetical protein
MCTAARIHWLRLRNPPPPAFGLIYEGTKALLVSQDRRHLFVTPWGGTLQTLENIIKENGSTLELDKNEDYQNRDEDNLKEYTNGGR